MMSTWVDLSHPLHARMCSPQYFPKPSFERVFELTETKPQVTQFSLCTHHGTHLDAPAHFIAGGKTLDEFPVDRFVLPSSVVAIDVPGMHPISAADLKRAGAAPQPGDALLIACGWDRYWADDRYLSHPYLAEDAAQWLVDCGVRLAGFDVMTPDMPVGARPAGFAFPVHKRLLAHDVLIVENLTGLGQLRAARFELHALPIPIQFADGAPARVVARLHHHGEPT